MNHEVAIRAEGLTRKFGAFTAVDHISFSVEKGEIFGFLGANGAGKTTAIKMLCGLLQPSGGKASVGGFDIFRQTGQLRRNIGYMSQRFSLYEDLSPYENLRFYGGIYGLPRREIKPKAEAVLKKLGLWEEKDQLVSALPLGWKQKLAFSVASFHEPAIVFLDEPTSGVDPVTRRQFWHMIYEAAHQGTTIFITTHYMEEAEYCKRVSIMVSGRIQALDTPGKLKEQYQVSSMDEVFLKLTR